MICVDFAKNNETYRMIMVSGHAGYAEKGKDIVCAGVSAMLGAMLNGLEHFVPDGFVYHVNPEGKADIVVSAKLSQQQKEKVFTIVKTFELGIFMLQQDYPEYLLIHEEEVD